MSEKVDLSGWDPPVEKGSTVDRDAVILRAIVSRGVSYPSEIACDTEISKTLLYDRLRILEKHGILKHVRTDMFVPEELKPRLKELWAMGLKGNMIKRMTWYTITDLGFEKYSPEKDFKPLEQHKIPDGKKGKDGV